MIDPRRNKSLPATDGGGCPAGFVSALVTFVFMAVVNQGIALVWEQAMLASGLNAGLFTILVCTLGGLLVGLLVSSLATIMPSFRTDAGIRQNRAL